MNRERLQQVRDRIAAEPPENLTMRTYECGTAHCIAGWSCVVAGRDPGHIEVEEEARHLGLSGPQSGDLFWPQGWLDDGHTKADALAALDSLINADSDDALPVWPEPRA